METNKKRLGSDDGSAMRLSREDPGHFEVIFDRHYDVIYGYLARRAGREAAEAITSETFCVAFDQRWKYDVDRPDARPWLFAIAINLMKRHWRTEHRGLALIARLRTFTLSSTAPDPAEELSSRCVEGTLRSALADLPAIDREVVLLFAWGDLTYKEIAEVLQIPTGTVQSRLHRARVRLREQLSSAESRPVPYESNKESRG